jgi:hypothetical protein
MKICDGEDFLSKRRATSAKKLKYFRVDGKDPTQIPSDAGRACSSDTSWK